MADDAAEYTRFRTTVKGKRLRFFEAKGVDELVSISLALAQELWILRARHDLLERAAIAGGLLPAGGLAAAPGVSEILAPDNRERAEFIDRIFFTLREEAEALTSASSAEPEPPAVT